MKIRRLHQPDAIAPTFGHLVDDDETIVCCTMELPWHDNEPQISCIPPGKYTCKRRPSPHFQCDVFEIRGVPGRSLILLHPANYIRELRGCVALGESFADLNADGVTDLASSRKAFEAFMASKAGVSTFVLDVLNP